MQKIDNFFSQIQDGAWHSLKELAKNSETRKKKLEKLSELLAEPDIIEYKPKKGRIKIRETWQKFLENTNKMERCTKAAIGTIILPPERTVSIQGVQMTNLLKTEIEIRVRVNKKLEEVALGFVERD